MWWTQARPRAEEGEPAGLVRRTGHQAANGWSPSRWIEVSCFPAIPSSAAVP